ncbi:hypothetical protein ES705_29987 [subsurface metagenome]
MKVIIIEKLKVGDIILAYDSEFFKWMKCRVNQVEKYLVTLEYIEGNLKDFLFYENIKGLKNSDYYRMAG